MTINEIIKKYYDELCTELRKSTDRIASCSMDDFDMEYEENTAILHQVKAMEELMRRIEED